MTPTYHLPPTTGNLTPVTCHLSPEISRRRPQVTNEEGALSPAGLLVRRAEDRRGMHGREHVGSEGRRDQLSAASSHPEGFPEQGLRRRGAQADEHAGLDHGELRLQPGPAGRDLEGVRFLMNPFLSARLPLEVLHDVRDVGVAPIDAGFRQRLVQQPPRAADEGAPLDILAISRLLPDEEEARLARALPEHRLRAAIPEVAGAADGRGAAEIPQSRAR